MTFNQRPKCNTVTLLLLLLELIRILLRDNFHYGSHATKSIYYKVLTAVYFSSFLGKKEVENCREQLSAAKRHAESIALITPELEKEFLEVCLYYGLQIQHENHYFSFKFM